MIKRLFKEHPETVGETYVEHAQVAGRMGWMMFVGSLACFVHAAFPFLCVRTGSRTIKRLHEAASHRVPSAAANTAPMGDKRAA
ncbi:MAG: hypothetical protein HRU11_12370 [Parvularculaceae bacterium]|nr:hypothetical protein [Parvularculaceae bacterium]